MKQYGKTFITTLALGMSAWVANAQQAPPQPDQAAPPPPRQMAPREGRPYPASPIVAALDANHDGLVSAEEIANAAAALRKLDSNNDGQLTRDEWRPALAPRGAGGPPAWRGQGQFRERGQGQFRGPGQGQFRERGQGQFRERGQGQFRERGQGQFRERGQGQFGRRGQGQFGGRGQPYCQFAPGGPEAPALRPGQPCPNWDQSVDRPRRLHRRGAPLPPAP